MIKRFADRLFQWFCHPDYYPDIKGDLEELYADHLENHRRGAQWRYAADVLLLFRPSLLRSFSQNSFIKDTGMLSNYLKISIRSLSRHKLFTAINVLGLAIGLASFLLISEYIQFEQSYDRHFSDADQLYRVSTVEVVEDQDGVKDAMASYLVGEVLNEEIPEVLNHTVTKKLDPITFRYEDKMLLEDYVVSADSNFLSLFDYEVLNGSPETMLNQPLSVVLTQSKARAFFGDEDPMGKTIHAITPYQAPLTVTGIIEDTPETTHYRFQMLVSDRTLEDDDDYKSWNYNNHYIYVKLEQNANLINVQKKADEVIKKFDVEFRWDVHPITSIHLQSDFTYEPQIHGNKQAVEFLVIASLLILIIAWVNYVNLSTARALDRAKEVGLRKVVGAFRKQLVKQFLFEALMINLLGALLALVVAELALPVLNDLVGKEILDHVWNHPPFLLNLLTFWLLGALVSGFYPAIVLSSFKPIAVLTGKFRNSKKGVFLRKGLVIVQFTTSLVLIAATFIIYQQVKYMQSRDLGISVEKVISVELPTSDAETREEYDGYLQKIKQFKLLLAGHEGVKSVGATSNLPGGDSGDINATNSEITLVGFSEPLNGTTYFQMNDQGFLDAMELRLLAGRNFNPYLASDSNAIIVNEALIDRFKLEDPTQAVDAILDLGGDRLKVVGIIKDFHRTSLKQAVEPTIYAARKGVRKLVIKLDDQGYATGIAHLEDQWEEYFPDAPMDLIFMDARFNALYDQDRRFGDLFIVFASLAILIAILGLYGLASFLSIQRSKEVGVRKALGANRAEIVYLFYKGFLQLIGISAIIGFPLSYFVMNDWLNNYAFRIAFPWETVVMALLVVLLFAFLTVWHQTRKVAGLNPAQTLKYE
ncbi:MAG: FtsX-like permease family protein [Bacteroidota bacterium]